jgi:hypothetical protein
MNAGRAPVLMSRKVGPQQVISWVVNMVIGFRASRVHLRLALLRPWYAW